MTAIVEPEQTEVRGSDLRDARPALRKEHVRLLRGMGRYVDDIDPAECLHMAFVRSPLANARITSINVSRAAVHPGVRLVLTSSDLHPLGAPLPLLRAHPSMTHPRTQPPLASERVCYVGQPVAAVVARTRYEAEDACERIEVDYEPAPAAVGVERAIIGEELVHDDVPQNIAGEMRQRSGDPDAAFRDAPFVEKLRLRIERSCGSPIETRGIVAAWDPRLQRLEVWDSTQNPVAIHHGLVRLLGLSEEQARVAAPDVGGGFGTKIMMFYPEEVLVPYAAIRVERPVKWVEDRWEHLIAANQERGQVHDAEVAFDAEGRILAVRTRFLHDTGAFAPYGPGVPEVTITHLRGQYRIAHFEATARIVYTNTPSVTPYRGAGRPQAVFVMERLIAAVARRLGLEPLEVRRRNLIRRDEFPYDTGLELLGTRVVYDSGDYESAFSLMEKHLPLGAFRERQRRERAHGRLLGIGFGAYVEGAAPGPYESAVCRLDDTGSLTVIVSPPTQGQGHQTMFARLAGDIVGVHPDDVIVVQGDSARLTSGSGTFGSRVAVIAGNAVADAARSLRRQLTQFAAELHGCAPQDVVVNSGRIGLAGDANTFASLADFAAARNPMEYAHTTIAARELAAKARERGLTGWPLFEARGHYAPTTMTYGSGVHGAVVEVDPETGLVIVRSYHVVDDCGVALEPETVLGQIYGGVAQGIGGALLERLVFDADGQPQTTTFMDFLLPTIADVPEIEVHHLETPSPTNPLGAKGVGEAGVIAASAVIAEAIEDALSGHRVVIDSMPLFPEAVVSLIRAR